MYTCRKTYAHIHRVQSFGFGLDMCIYSIYIYAHMQNVMICIFTTYAHTKHRQATVYTFIGICHTCSWRVALTVVQMAAILTPQAHVNLPWLTGLKFL